MVTSEYMRTANEHEACARMYAMLTPVRPMGPAPTAQEEAEMVRRTQDFTAQLDAKIAAKQKGERPSS